MILMIVCLIDCIDEVVEQAFHYDRYCNLLGARRAGIRTTLQWVWRYSFLAYQVK